MTAPATNDAAGARSSGRVVAAPWRRLAAHPALAAGAALVRRVTPNGAGPLVLYGLYTLVLFAIFLGATFPHELALRRALEPAATAPIAIDVRGVHLGWTLGYTIDELRLRRRDDDPALPILVAAHVGAAPSLLGLLHGQPFPITARAELYGGTVEGTVDLRPDAFAVRARLAHVDAARYAALRLFMEGTLQGRIDGTLELTGNAARPAWTSGTVDLRATDLALEAGKVLGITVPNLHFPEMRVQGVVKAGRLELGDVNARGREVTARGSGNVLLQHPLAASLLNLDLVLTPAADLAENLRLLLNLVPGEPTAEGGRRVHLAGTIAQPRLK